jgi:hypothetical protein
MNVRRIVAAALLLSALIVPELHIGTALASCVPGRSSATQSSNWHDAAIRYIQIPTNQYGDPTQDASVLADIYQYDPYVYRNADTSAWVMMQIYNGSSSCCWAQVGWDKYDVNGTDYRETFTQWTHDETFSENDWPGDVSPGQTTRYQVYFEGYAFGNWLFYRSGSLIDAEGPEFIPTSAYVSGEINNLASQMPGGSSSNSVHEVFSNMGYMQPANTWGNFGGSATNPYSQYFGNYYNTTNWLAIWDKACSS